MRGRNIDEFVLERRETRRATRFLQPLPCGLAALHARLGEKNPPSNPGCRYVVCLSTADAAPCSIPPHHQGRLDNLPRIKPSDRRLVFLSVTNLSCHQPKCPATENKLSRSGSRTWIPRCSRPDCWRFTTARTSSRSRYYAVYHNSLNHRGPANYTNSRGLLQISGDRLYLHAAFKLTKVRTRGLRWRERGLGLTITGSCSC